MSKTSNGKGWNEYYTSDGVKMCARYDASGRFLGTSEFYKCGDLSMSARYDRNKKFIGTSIHRPKDCYGARQSEHSNARGQLTGITEHVTGPDGRQTNFHRKVNHSPSTHVRTSARRPIVSTVQVPSQATSSVSVVSAPIQATNHISVAGTGSAVPAVLRLAKLTAGGSIWGWLFGGILVFFFVGLIASLAEQEQSPKPPKRKRENRPDDDFETRRRKMAELRSPVANPYRDSDILVRLDNALLESPDRMRQLGFGDEAFKRAARLKAERLRNAQLNPQRRIGLPVITRRS